LKIHLVQGYITIRLSIKVAAFPSNTYHQPRTGYNFCYACRLAVVTSFMINKLAYLHYTISPTHIQLLHCKLSFITYCQLFQREENLYLVCLYAFIEQYRCNTVVDSDLCILFIVLFFIAE